MFKKCEQDNCGFDWANDPYGLEVELYGSEISDDMDLFCPNCGSHLGGCTTRSLLGVIGDGNNCRQWDDMGGEAAAESTTGASLAVIRVIQENGQQIPRIRMTDVFYESVPGFFQPDGEVRIPDLPVRPEMASCVDWEKIDVWQAQPVDDRKSDRVKFGVYDKNTGKSSYLVPLRGRDASKPVVCEVLGRNGARLRDESNALRGFELTLWPNVRSENWRLFLVDVRWSGEGVTQLVDLEKTVAFAASICLRDNEELLPIQPIAKSAQAPFGGRTRRFNVHTQGRGRPRWISVRFGSPTRERRPDTSEWGGLFCPDPPVPVAQDAAVTAELGVDFGTSNSCVAVRWGGANAEVLRAVDLHLYLSAARAPGTQIPADEYHIRPPQGGFGPRGSVFPTELLLAEEAGSGGNGTLDRAVPFRDYTIPGNDVDWRVATKPVDVDAFILKRFKWKSGTDGGSLGADRREAAIRAYARALLIEQFARVVASRERREAATGIVSRVAPVPPINLTVIPSFPARWTGPEVRDLCLEFSRAAGFDQDQSSADEKPGDQTATTMRGWCELGTHSVVSPGVDEALAAARQMSEMKYAGENPPKRVLKIVADVGGGSTDIAALWTHENAPGQNPPALEYLTSFRFAGEDLFSVLEGPKDDPRYRCFASGVPSSEIMRRLRTSGATDAIFDPPKFKMRDRRVDAFYAHLVDYLGRMVASVLYNGAHSLQNPAPGAVAGEPVALGAPLGTLAVYVCMTGNGWRMAEYANANYQAKFTDDLQNRIVELILPRLQARHEQGAPPLDFAIAQISPEDNADPKHVVALGVLREGSQRDPRKLSNSDRPQSSTSTSGAAGISMAGLLRVQKAESTSATLQDPNRDATWTRREIMGIPCEAMGDVKVTVPWHVIVEDDGKHTEAVQGPRVGPNHTLRWSLALCEAQNANFPERIVDADLDKYLSQEAQKVEEAVRGPSFFRRGLLTVLLERGLRNRLTTLL